MSVAIQPSMYIRYNLCYTYVSNKITRSLDNGVLEVFSYMKEG